jgi:hypothetical protein
MTVAIVIAGNGFAKSAISSQRPLPATGSQSCSRKPRIAGR